MQTRDWSWPNSSWKCSCSAWTRIIYLQSSPLIYPLCAFIRFLSVHSSFTGSLTSIRSISLSLRSTEKKGLDQRESALQRTNQPRRAFGIGSCAIENRVCFVFDRFSGFCRALSMLPRRAVSTGCSRLYFIYSLLYLRCLA